jgi:hypothetical protein
MKPILTSLILFFSVTVFAQEKTNDPNCGTCGLVLINETKSEDAPLTQPDKTYRVQTEKDNLLGYYIYDRALFEKMTNSAFRDQTTRLYGVESVSINQTTGEIRLFLMASETKKILHKQLGLDYITTF